MRARQASNKQLSGKPVGDSRKSSTSGLKGGADRYGGAAELTF